MEDFKINNYSFSKPLKSLNSGFSKWGIGKRDDRRFFVKEFLSPVYPVENALFSEETKQVQIQVCQDFVEEKLELYSAVREADEGHVVYVEQFFRVGAKFYMVTKAIEEPALSVPEIARCSFLDGLRLCCAIAHAMAKIHEKKIVHADIKPSNILVVRKNGLWPYIIDFDCSFLEHKCPKLGEELNGDLVYLSPEGFLHIAEEESNLSCKMDVFALGLLFYEYLTGKLPGFDAEEYQYAYEAVLDDHPLDVQGIVNASCRQVIAQMLEKRPEDRPDMRTVFHSLNNILLQTLKRTPPEHVFVEQTMPKETELARSTFEDSFFHMGGDL